MLKIEKISKTFNPGTIHEKAALQGLSLHLLPGDFVTVIGSNGAGKPTSKRIDEEADTYAFLFQNIGVPYKPVAK